MPNRLSKISLVGMETEPKLTFAIKHTINTNINMTKENLYVLVSVNYSKSLKKYG